MRIRLTFRIGRQTAPPPEFFSTGFSYRPRPLLPMFGSLAAHAALFALLPLVAEHLARDISEDLDLSAYRVQFTHLRVPEPVYYVPEPRESSDGKDGRLRPSVNATLKLESGRGPEHAAAPILKGIELPQVEVKETATGVTLQPETRQQVRTPAPDLPPLAFWARRDRTLPKLRREELITPGRAQKPDQVPRLAAPPVLAVPNLEPSAGEKNIGGTPSDASGPLSQPTSSTAPLRDRPSDPQTGTFEWTAGQAANLIAFSAARARPGDEVVVPPGSHSLRSRGDNPRATAGFGEKTGMANGGVQASDTVKGGVYPEPASFPNGSGPTSADNRRNRPDASERNSPVSSSTLPLNAFADSVFEGAETFVRIMHPPNANFDVVVVQSGARDDSPAIGGGLTGSPVYTVYLQVGDQKDWVLQFCLPPSQRPRNGSYEVYVENSAPLVAPYPATTIIPQSISGSLRSTPLVFHGALTAAGIFRNMTANDSSTIAAKIASVLEQWQFRPARRNNIPVDIEVLLICLP